MSRVTLLLEAWDESYAGVVESKGWYPTKVTINDVNYPVEFYDKVRLLQEITDAISNDGYFTEDCKIIVLEKVTRELMERAIMKLSESDF